MKSKLAEKLIEIVDKRRFWVVYRALEVICRVSCIRVCMYCVSCVCVCVCVCVYVYCATCDLLVFRELMCKVHLGKKYLDGLRR